ncbi:MAG TPA: AAA family ATPase [Candidatus Elarobacter sp.]|nr:AAA family ATPase [Candidatus Elarobacter sp.]
MTRVETARTVTSSGVFCRELIGRSPELAFLREQLRPRAERGSCLLVVRGEAGMGKTRLVEELLAAASADGFTTASAATREYANAPFAAIQEALARLAIDVPAAGDDDEADGKARRFEAFAAAIAGAAQRAARGIVVAIEDLHWADVSSLELLRFLAARLAPYAATIVVTYRSDEIEDDAARARATLALERDADGVVALDSLAPNTMQLLVGAVLRDADRSLSPSVVARVCELSDGRPLFAEELLRGVLERLDRDARAEPAVPASIRVTVRERFATLNDTDRSILLHAAVVGRRFPASLVASLSGVDLPTVYGALRRARDLQLIVEQADDAGGDAFSFRHALTREAVYGELLRAEARLMHAKVAQLLVADPMPDAAEVADHLWRAGEVEGAAAWSERAGDAAAAVYAYADAARAYERAFALVTDDARRASLAERAGDACYALADLSQSAEWFGRAAEAYGATAAASRAWRMALRRARVLFEGGRYDAGLQEADRLASFPGVEPAARVEAELMIAGLLAVHGRASDALERLRAAERLGVPPDGYVRIRMSATYAMAFTNLGEPDAARASFEDAIAMARASGDDDMLLRTYNNWGNCEIVCGNLERANALYAEALGGAERTKNVRVFAWISHNVALVRLLAGDFAGARERLAGPARVDHGVPLASRWAAALTVRAATLQGRLRDDDESRLRAALDGAIDSADLSSIALLSATLAHRLAADERFADAAAAVERVAPLFDGFDVPYWLADAASRFGDAAARARARELVAIDAARPGKRIARAVLAMLDARDAVRSRRRTVAIARASDALAIFRESGWVLYEAFALELAGRTADALALFRRIGAAGEVRRRTATRGAPARRRGESTLTEREREIAGLMVTGEPTRAIARTLVISERTVETHIASIYRKLGVSNRRALEALLQDGRPPTSP